MCTCLGIQTKTVADMLWNVPECNGWSRLPDVHLGRSKMTALLGLIGG